MSKNDLWGKYWISKGIEVVHRDRIGQPNLESSKMYVQRIIKKKIYSDTKESVGHVIDGIRCYWYDKKGELKVENFHSKHLIPYEIAIQGVEETNKWISRPC